MTNPENNLSNACDTFRNRNTESEAGLRFLYSLWGRLEEHGQDLAEYSLLLALIAVVVIVAVTLMGTQVSALFQEIFTALDPPLPP